MFVTTQHLFSDGKPLMCGGAIDSRECHSYEGASQIVLNSENHLPMTSIKVATDAKILDLRTRLRTKLGWFFWF